MHLRAHALIKNQRKNFIMSLEFLQLKYFLVHIYKIIDNVPRSKFQMTLILLSRTYSERLHIFLFFAQSVYFFISEQVVVKDNAQSYPEKFEDSPPLGSEQ